MSRNLSKKSEKESATLSNQVAQEPQSAHATPVVEKYVEKRKDKAEEQAQKEQSETNAVPQTKSVWDEWVSYRYAIL
jgi:cobalamin biosynthesis protein CbiG